MKKNNDTVPIYRVRATLNNDGPFVHLEEYKDLNAATTKYRELCCFWADKGSKENIGTFKIDLTIDGLSTLHEMTIKTRKP